MKTDSFLRGAFVLTAAAIFVKLLGACYRIPFTRMVGSEGIGLYQMAYPLYTTLLALSSAGIPVAVSFLVAERGAVGDRRGARRILWVSLLFLFSTGLLLALSLFLGAPYLAREVLGDPRACYSLAAVAPAVLVISVVSAFRGYFQGWGVMWPTALSEVLEQVIRVATVLLAASALISRGVEFAAAGAAFGAVTGGCAGLLVLVLIFGRFERSRPLLKGPGRSGFLLGDGLKILKRLLVYAFPISAASAVFPLMQAIDTVIIPNRLQAAGFSVQEATSLFGQLAGMAGTIVYLPAVFTVSVAMSLVPHLAAAVSRGSRLEVRRRISTALRITVIFCLPAAAGLCVLATPIMELLFNEPGAGPVTAWLAPAALFAGLQQTTAGALQGIGNTWLPVVNLLAGCLVKIACNYYLTVLPGFGIKGAALGSSLGFFLVFLLNFWFLSLFTGYRLQPDCLLRPLLAATIMVAALPGIYNLFYHLGNAAATGAAVLGGAALYFAVLFLTGEIRVYEVRRILKR